MDDRKLRFECTCSACPEQYDVYLDDKQVGYVRLRWGTLRVQCPDVGGEVVYEVNTEGFGDFASPCERDYHLRFAGKAILDYVDGRLEKPVPPPVSYEIVGEPGWHGRDGECRG